MFNSIYSLLIIAFYTSQSFAETEKNDTNSETKERFNVFGSPMYQQPFNTMPMLSNSGLHHRPFDTQCFLPNEGAGHCIPLERCSHLRELYANGYNLREYRCAYSPSIVFVCCTEPKFLKLVTLGWTWDRETTTPLPLAQINQQETSSTKRKPTRKPTTEIPPSQKPSGHPNERLLPDSCGIDVSNKIVGGEETALDEYSWMALLRYRFGGGRTVFGCGGSVISERYVLTAAHCLKSKDLPPNVIVDKVRLGEHDLNTNIDCINGQCNKPPQDIDIEDRIVHEGYDPQNDANYNDIALLRLRTPAKFGVYVNPICLPLNAQLRSKSYVGKILDVAGWGRTTNSPRSNSPLKLKVGVPVLDNRDCDPYYRRNGIQLIDSQICAGGESGKDSCQGDSGGPLMSADVINSEVRWHVTGIVSFGPPSCGSVNNPAIYTRVANFVDWVLNNIRK